MEWIFVKFSGGLIYIFFSTIFQKNLYENYLLGDKWKYRVTLDEAKFTKIAEKRKSLFTIKNEEKKYHNFGSINANKVSPMGL